MITAAFLAVLAVAVLGGTRLAMWLFSQPTDDDWDEDVWWRQQW